MTDKHVIPQSLAITAMRDSGYKNTAYALAELIDNSQQAGAKIIEVIAREKRAQATSRVVSRLHNLAVLDNGSGMDAATLQMALQFGNGTRLDDRSGIGRFGMGLPNASISQAGRVDVWSWRNGTANALHTYIDVEEIEDETMVLVPAAKHEAVPSEWLAIGSSFGKTGTLVVWSKIDPHRLTWKTAKPTLKHTSQIAGRIYRRFIHNASLQIRMVEVEGEKVVKESGVPLNDRLYLIPSSAVPPPFDKKPMFEETIEQDHEVEYNGKRYKIHTKYSVARQDTVSEAAKLGARDRGSTPWGKHAADNMGISVMRAGRELILDRSWCIGYDPRERWWAAEVEFPPALDEIFGVPNNKQAANHFTELATLEWEDLAEQGEDFKDVVNRLNDEGDPRGLLLKLSDEIKQNLRQVRELIRSQGRTRTAASRHVDADKATITADEGWKDRSRKEKPLEDDAKSNTAADLKKILTDLTEVKKYDEETAKHIVKLIKERDLKIIFLEADFPNEYQLFNVERKGNTTELTFNQKHPAFDQIFGTVSMVDEDLSKLSSTELLECLSKAVNATKIIFGAWARYEREVGITRLSALQRVRNDWGHIAAQFLKPDDNVLL
jgi:hypothetical protein